MQRFNTMRDFVKSRLGIIAMECDTKILHTYNEMLNVVVEDPHLLDKTLKKAHNSV